MAKKSETGLESSKIRLHTCSRMKNTLSKFEVVKVNAIKSKRKFTSTYKYSLLSSKTVHKFQACLAKLGIY